MHALSRLSVRVAEQADHACGALGVTVEFFQQFQPGQTWREREAGELVAAKKQGILGSMFVEAPKDAKYAYDKAVVRMTTKTKFQKQNGKLVEDAKFEDIKNGMKVSIWFTGPVAESDPVQATAGTVLIFPK